MKPLTLDQIESRKEKAVHFTRDVLDDPDRADEIEDESLEDYAERRGFQITNPSTNRRKKAIMPTGKTKAELEAEIADLQDENQELQDQLDAIADIVSPDDGNGDDDDNGDDDNGDDDDGDDDDQDDDDGPNGGSVSD